MNRVSGRRISRRAFMRGLAAASAGAGAIALVGCGGDKAASPTPTRPLTKAATAGAVPTAPTPATIRTWRQVELSVDNPGPRRDHSLTTTPSGSILLFGGRLKGSSLDDLWQFDPASLAWTKVDVAGAVPPARFAHNATWDASRSRLVISMGQGAGGALYNDVWAFDPATKSWTDISANSAMRPEVRYGSGGAHDVAGDRLLMSHGFTDTGRFDDTWTFDLATGSWSKIATLGTPPIKRCLLRTLWVPAKKQMLLFGGQTDNNPFLGDFWALDLAAGAWSEKKPSPLPGARNLVGASLDASAKRWYIVGGNTPDGPSSEAWSYDLAADAWAPAEDPASSMMLPPRYSPDAAVVGDTLYVYGGNDGKTEIGDMWALPLAS